MSAPRFYCPVTLPTSGLFELPPAAAHHAQRVLRLRVGDHVQIFDGEGQACDATINNISGKRVDLDILKSCPAQQAATLHIVLAQAMTSSEKMDWIVQRPPSWVLLKFSRCKPSAALPSLARSAQKSAPNTGAAS